MHKYKIYKSNTLDDSYMCLFKGSKSVDRMELCDFVLLEDGPVVKPSNIGVKGYENVAEFSYDPSRDYGDELVVSEAVFRKKPIVGIGRGAIVLALMAGSNIIQRCKTKYVYGDILIDRPVNTSRYLRGYTNFFFRQAMHPFNLDESEYRIITHSRNSVEQAISFNTTTIPTTHKIPDMVYFKTLNAVAIQSNPEKLAAKFLGEESSLFKKKISEGLWETGRKMINYLNVISATVHTLVKESKESDE